MEKTILMCLLSLVSGYKISTFPDHGACELAQGPRPIEVGDYISSPEYPEPYPGGMHCEWLVTDDEGDEEEPVMITFLDFNMAEGGTCPYDVLRIYDGVNDKAPLLATLCTSTLHRPVLATGNQMFIRFESDPDDESNLYRGFLALIQRQEEDIACNTTLAPRMLEHGDVLASPDFPGNYPNDALCEWRATVETGLATLDFLHFTLEPEMPQCQYDAVEVYDGPDDQSTMLGLFCATTLPFPVVATGYDMFIRFRSDFSNVYSGFQAVITDTDVDACDSESGAQPLRPGQIFSSPNFPNNYPNNAACEWRARTEDAIVVLTFLDFAIEETPGCARDAVEVYDGPDATSPVIGAYCGYLRPDQIAATGNVLFIRFRTDSDVTYGGFEAIITEREVEDFTEVNVH